MLPKGLYDKPSANVIVNGQKLTAFALRSAIRQARLFSPLLFNMALEHVHTTKAMYRVNTIPVEVPMAYSTELKQIFQTLIATTKTLDSHSNLEEAERSWRNHSTSCQTILQRMALA